MSRDQSKGQFDLFGESEAESAKGAPLAHRMRPSDLADFAGQPKVLGPGAPLRQWIESDQIPSLVFWGPPGCGKTTLARIIAARTSRHFDALSAVLSGVKDIKEAVERARGRLRLESARRTILFVDEVHRFNKSQQDALLPHVEDGTVTLIGATTENPSFELNSALLSRARVLRLEPLGAPDLAGVLRRALSDAERGLGGRITVADDAVEWIAATSEGDARRALAALEAVAMFFSKREPGHAVGVDDARRALESAMTRQPLPYDKNGEEHYNVISAFIKSIRDSDPHAGLYYMARMLECGEDPLFVARRLVILASEDVGNADPRALQVAIAAKEAVDFVGMPEARINLAQAVTYLACAPKSNASYEGIEAAFAEVRRSGGLPVPLHLRNAPTRLMKDEGYGKGYQYAHAESGAVVRQRHLPEALVGKRFYEPKDSGLEAQIRQKLEKLNPLFG